MIRIIIICEGETEQGFCKKILTPYFAGKNILLETPLIKKSKGGIVHWKFIKDQIERHLKQDKSAIVSTLIDYYGLYQKHDFPRWSEAESITDRHNRMLTIEHGMKEDIDGCLNYRFIPYIQLHEFEGLLFNEKQIFYEQIPNEDIVDHDLLNQTFANYSNPEMINNSKETSPSHRLEKIVQGYQKIVYGEILAEAIGIRRIMDKCPRFKRWIEIIENIDQ